MTHPDPDQRRVSARYRLAVALVGATTVLAFFLLVDFAGTGRAGFHPAWLVVAALCVGPLVLLAALVRTIVGTAFGGVVLLAATGGFLVAIFSSESSTAGIGLVTALLGEGGLELRFEGYRSMLIDVKKRS